jgi:hypothetical protein
MQLNETTEIEGKAMMISCAASLDVTSVAAG